MTRQLRILILEDRPADAELVRRELRKAGIPFTSNCVANEADFLAQLSSSPPDLILADYSLPSYDGLSALADTRKACPETPFIFVSGSLGEEAAIEALHRGATDYVFKERLTRLAPAVRRAMREIEERAQRRQAEDSLRASERSYQEMFNATHDAIFVHDAATGAVLEVNRRALEMSGYSREELLNQAGETSRPDGPFSHQEAVRRIRLAAAEGPQLFEWQSNRKNGELLWSEVSLRGANIGGQGRVLAVVRDITERKRAEAALRESESLYQSLVENVPQHIFRKDAAGRFTFGNGPFCEALGKTDHDFFPAELAAKYRQDDLRVLQTGQPFEGEETFEEAGGGSVIVNVLKTPVRDGAGQIVGLQGISWNITERRRAQEALAASEANYRSLVEQSPDAIFLHCEGKFVYANPAALKLLRAEQTHQILGRPVLDIVPPENQDSIRQRIQHATELGVALPLEQKILRLDKTAVEVEATSIRFTHLGKPAVQTIMRDITERNQLEHQLRQAQKMEAVGQLAGGVAHDFNNMLAVIRGNAELLLMKADESTPGNIDCLKQINTASERAATLTRQLLAFSRKQVMQSRPLILNDVVAELTKMLRRIIGEHIDLQCRYFARLPFVQADAAMIEQVLLNLAVNARDAMPRGGQLLITTETASFDAAYARTHPEAGAGEFACLAVSDSGTGIAPEHLPRIFEPFFTTKELGKGTGLGLATVYGIVKQHQGWIEVSSRPGAGATFKIFLPAIPPPAATAAPVQAGTVLPGGTETILLVEDDFDVRTITRRMLESHGYKIHEATTAKEALEFWRNRPEEITLLLTDIVMPQGVTGRDLAEQLRASKPTLKVILMSGYNADVIGKDTSFFHRSKSYFLQKPCSPRTLLETVRACLDAKG